MRLLILALSLGVGVAILATAAVAGAATTDSGQTVVKKSMKTKKAKAAKGLHAKASTAAAKKKVGGDLSTDVKFDDSVLHGQYQTPDEALAKVENEKGLNDLIGVRKHFKDRLSTASDQE